MTDEEMKALEERVIADAVASHEALPEWRRRELEYGLEQVARRAERQRCTNHYGFYHPEVLRR